ncbi:MAG: thioredoxin domain-containing protein [Actinomycetota bacterium]|nr:thioredoxin domain-containing protein [Actinomycetota bacterium]
MSLIFQVSDFEQDVVATSRRVPVLVDFWAEWCMPCQPLFQVLEDLVEVGAGSFLLAKVDVEANPDVASRLGVTSLPAITLYSNGEAVEGMAGTMAKMQIKALLSRHLDGWDSDGA